MYDEAAEHDDAANAETADNRCDNDNSDDHVLLAPRIAAGPCPSKARGDASMEAPPDGRASPRMRN